MNRLATLRENIHGDTVQIPNIGMVYVVHG